MIYIYIYNVYIYIFTHTDWRDLTQPCTRPTRPYNSHTRAHLTRPHGGSLRHRYAWMGANAGVFVVAQLYEKKAISESEQTPVGIGIVQVLPRQNKKFLTTLCAVAVAL